MVNTMKKFLAIVFLTTSLTGVFLSLLFWVASPFLNEDEKLKIFSPLPAFLSVAANAQVTTLDIWKPFDLRSNTDISFVVTAHAALSYDLTASQLLFEKNAQQKVPMASLTKIMTAIVALEHPKVNDTYAVSADALVGEDSMGLEVGEALSLKELLYGLFLNSGNDAAEVIAENFPGGREKFIDAMNQKAKTFGLQNTHFTNPTGLQGEGDQHTTAEDLLVITRFALENFPVIKETGSAVEYIIPQTTTHKEYDLVNETNLLTTYPGVEGLKTGYTPEAGYCLVTYLEYGGHKIIGIVLGSDDRRKDMKDILDYSLKKLGINPPTHQ